MATTVTVPGAPTRTIISYSFDGPQNVPVAQAIAAALISALGADQLNAQVYVPPPGTTSPAVAGETNELVIAPSLAGGTVFVPPGYAFAADITAVEASP